MTARSAHPPASWTHCGRSQWYSVGYGVIPCAEQLVHEAVVVVEARPVDPARRVRHDPRPGDAEPIGAQAQLAQERDVLWVAVVLVARDVTRRPVEDLARRVGEPVPDRLALPVLPPRAFHLIGGRRRSPDEAGREGCGSQHVATPPWSPISRAVFWGRRRQWSLIATDLAQVKRTSTRTRGVPGGGSGTSVPSTG